ncbi:MAG TPA: aminotransferase, partial [Brevibacterium ravenspurgense]|nr:aminotransferase [Brevibacterium ravenspurgense]
DVRAKEVAAARDKLTEELRALGIEVPTSDANYVWLPLGERSADFEKVCMAKGLAVRNLQTGIRVSIGPDDAMERFIAVTREFLGK